MSAVIVIVIACWILTIALSALLLTPVLDQVDRGLLEPRGLLTRFLSPPWLRLLLAAVVASLAAAIAAGVMLARELGGERSTVAVLTRESALGAALGVPVLALLADQNWVAAFTAAALGAAAELWVHRASVSAITIALGAALATGPWLSSPCFSSWARRGLGCGPRCFCSPRVRPHLRRSTSFRELRGRADGSSHRFSEMIGERGSCS